MDRRNFLSRGTAALLGLSAGGALWRSPAQDANQAAGMINANTQGAIDRSLAWLATQQHQDGSFGTGNYHGNVAVTSLGGLAFMAGGFQPGRGRFGENVTRAVRYIIRSEDPNTPGFLNAARGFQHGPMYGHGFATLFLAEVYGMINEAGLRNDLRGCLGRAVRLIFSAQSNEGGWRYDPNPRCGADLSVTICQIMALRSARDAGIKVDAAVMEKALHYVKLCQTSDGGFSYMANGVGGSGFARTAAGTASLYYAGKFEDNAVTRGLDFLTRFMPGRGQSEEQGHYFYGQYYAVQAMFLAGGKYWSDWYPAIRDVLIERQNAQLGCWESEVDPDYCTAMALIILQMPNRYLPVFNGKGPGS
jgi:hypothetical protein